MSQQQKWQFWVDRGGTFTDIVAITPNAQVITRKYLSENPQQYQDAAIFGIRELLGIDASQRIPESKVACIRMGTTVATNALLERKGVKVALVITQGLADALEIAYQNRPDIFALNIQRPENLYHSVVQVQERVDAKGVIDTPLNLEEAQRALLNVYQQGIRSVAIVLMHAYAYPAHEMALADMAKQIGFSQISVSHQVSPLMKLVSRGDTTVMDAYLSPILMHYVQQVSAQLESGVKLEFMQSHGGLCEARAFAGKDAILSGPAGGVVGMVKTAALGFKQLIGFDMGGTSTDVSHFAGQYERSFNTQVAGVRVCVPMMQIHTVAAGGGSIVQFDGQRCKVGPESAGALPGPACYRQGGPLTVTDCNLLLGKIAADFFPKVFGPEHDQPLDEAIVQAKFAQLTAQINQSTGQDLSAADVAQGFLQIAVDNMANAIKQISIQRGYDVAHYTLACFGGAGAQHACLVADALGMSQILIHPHAGVLSAYGIGLSERRLIKEQACEVRLEAHSYVKLIDLINTLTQQAHEAWALQGFEVTAAQVDVRVLVKYAGSDSPLTLRWDILDSIKAQFSQMHQAQFGFVSPEKALWVESVQVELIAPETTLPHAMISSSGAAEAMANQRMYVEGSYVQVPVWQREALVCQQLYQGPMLVIEPNSTIVVESGWQLQRLMTGELILERYEALQHTQGDMTQCDPIQLELFNNLFMSIAQQMGAVLEKTAMSVNIKERLDFSCAIFNQRGELIANAPHIPVHLGSMSDSIKAVIRANPVMEQGDAYMLNSPYNGGTHLPDITVVKPVFYAGVVAFYVAARGHHADIGGITPGSMPPNSQHIQQEGILLDNVKLLRHGVFQEEEVHALLSAGPYPSRNIMQNIADLKAQLASCETGAAELIRISSQYGVTYVQRYMDYVMDNAEQVVRALLPRLTSGAFTYRMDQDAQIQVRIDIDNTLCQARIDFSGTSAPLASNFNAPRAVTMAAVLYVFRCLVAENIPLNDGFLRPLQIVVPEDCLLNPAYPSAVVAGNVETSQYIVDALFGALQKLAASQGTNNNFTFGDAQYQYYETLCGGAGAGEGFVGASAVHTHMTNSRLTDPEILEWRFPVLLREFAIRRGSGGAGRYHGGDGVVRKIEFKQPMLAAIISSHRIYPPFGLCGGDAGACGRNAVLKADGSVWPLQGCDQIEMQVGDQFVIETPGGGGWG